MSIDYPARHHDLQVLMGRLSRELPGAIAGFAHLHKEATGAGTLSLKFKELIALESPWPSAVKTASPITLMTP